MKFVKIWARYQLSIKDAKHSPLLVNKAVYVMTYPILRKAYSYTSKSAAGVNVYVQRRRKEGEPEEYREVGPPYVYVGSKPLTYTFTYTFTYKFTYTFFWKNF